MNLTKTKTLFSCLTVLSLMAPVAAYAGTESGFYLGGGLGESSVEAGSFDEDDTAYKVFGGFNIGFIPLVDFAVEASYVDFGTPEDITGFDAFGLAGLSFGPFGVFAKAGAISWDSDNDSGSDPAYGVGARFALGSIAIRAEYEEFDVDEADTFSMTSISAVFTF
jgi:hypothetical protein